MRYANGSPIDVAVCDNDGVLSVRVQDHGGTVAAEAIGAGSGLVGLQERVLLCGGQMEAGAAGPGYLLRVTLPLSDSPAVVDGTL